MEVHYFVNELVVPTIKCKWKRGKVLKVSNPQGASLQRSKKSLKKLQHYTPPGWYEYELFANVDGKGFETKLTGSKLKRPDDSCLTKDTLSAFLKQNAVLDARGIWVIKGSVLQQYNIQFVKFDDIFCGDPPVFASQISKMSKNEQRKLKSAFVDMGKQLGQQNIQKYFVSKKPAPVQSNQDYSESDDEVGDLDVNSELSVYEVSSEEESNNSGDEIKVVWASTVKPNKSAMNKLYKKMGKIDLGEGPIKIKQEPGISPDHKSLEENGKFRSPKKDSQKKLQSSSDDLESAQKGSISPRKKLKQTRMFDNPSSSHTDENKKPPFAVPLKKSRKNGVHSRRKQKIVGTLKPWVQKTQKNKGLSMGTSPVMKAETSNTTQTLKEKKKNWLEVQREIELREKERQQEERQRKKAKLEEEKLKFAKFMKEWRKHREDLLCEDLKPLPVPSEINCRIPNALFGDFMMVLEFLYSFSNVLTMKITGGVSFEILERALVETEIAGPLNDIIKVLLTTIFDLQVIEHEKPKSGVPIAADLNFDDVYNEDNEAMSQSVTATGWCDIFQDVSLHDIPITSTSISEILRLHLLGSGGRAMDTTSKCLSYRGGCINLEDPGMWLRVEKPTILQHLMEKLEILCCLVNQILTYASVRDKVDERCEQARQAKVSVRALQVAEIKLQKEATAKRIQEKKDAKLSLAKGSPLASSDQALYEKQKIEKEMNKLKVELQKKSTKVLPLAMSGQLLPLGSDRAHRKYWLFSSLPGLFVEYSPYEIGPCLPQPTPRALDLSDTLTHVRKLFEEESHNSSDKENDSSDRDVSKPQSASVKKMLVEQNNSVETLNISRPNEKDDTPTDAENVNNGELLLCTASNSCPVHCPRVSTSHWYFFTKQEDITALLESLNDRGIRESALLRVLKQEEQRIVECVSQCPVHKLNPEKFQFAEGEQRKSTRQHSGYKFDSVKSKFPPDTPISYIMEWTLRENILALENRIMLGRVGSLKVRNRMAWRKAIENGRYDKQSEKLVWGFRMRNKKQEKKVDKNTEEEDQKGESSEQDVVMEKVELSKRDEEEEAVVTIKQDKDNDKMETSESEQHSEEEEGSDVHYTYLVTSDSSESSDESAVVIYESPPTTTIYGLPVVKAEKIDGTEDKSSVLSPKTKVLSPKTKVLSPKAEVLSPKAEVLRPENMKKLMVVLHDCDILESPVNPDLDDESSSSEENENKLPNNEVSSDRIASLASVLPPCNPVIKDLASAILQVGQSLDSRCIKKPLADERGNVKSRIKYWEDSLMNSTNFSQLFIHLSTLENSINWANSVYNSPCFVCNSRKNGKKMIFCDGCDKRFHFFCVKPKLKCMPGGYWQCHYCAPKESGSSDESENVSNVLTRSSTTGRKRKAESDNVDGSESEHHHSKMRRTSKCDTCKKCAQPDELMCENEAEESAAEEPRGNNLTVSFDESCGEITDESCDESRDESAKRPVMKRPNKLESQIKEFESLMKNLDSLMASASARERRGSASAARAKIASFTKRLRSNSWDDDDAHQTSTTDTSMSSYNAQDSASKRRSSRRSLFASEDLPLDNAILQDLLTEMLQHKHAWPFVRPVRKSQVVPDYHTKIKMPMDLGTIKYKLNTAEYKTNTDFMKDIILVFENCFMYNHENSIEYHCGKNLLKFFEQRSRELGLNWKKDETTVE
ncbi:Homeotic protein female sterile [Gryllus bimaculatus]|nr:Homeotic protein female sterile [Gryllus bimaculatus]